MIWGAVALAAYAALAWSAGARGPWPAHLETYWGLHALAWIAACGAARTRLRARTVLAGAVVFRLLLLFVEPSLSDDVYRYVWEGRVQQLGFDPYRLSPDAPALAAYRDAGWERVNHRELAAIYPPLAQLVFRALSLAGGVVVFKAAFCVLDVAVVWLLIGALRRSGLPVARATLYAWNPLAVVEVAASGHLEPLGLLPLVVAATWAGHRPVAAWAAFACSAGMRYAALVAGPAFARHVPPRPRRVVLALGVLTAGFAFFAPSAWHLFDSLRVYADHWRGNDLVFACLQRLVGDADRTRVVAAAGIGLVAVASTVTSLWRGMHWALFGALVLAPIVHPWYLLWPLVLVPLAPNAAVLVWSATAPLAYHFLYPAFGRPPARFEDWGLLALEMAPVAVALAFDARRARRSVPRRETPAIPPPPAAGPAAAARVALVMPVLDEEPSLPLVFTALEPWRRDLQAARASALLDAVIVVDNGSRDRSAAIAGAAGATVLFEPQRGYGAACLRALAHLQAAVPPPDVVVFMDADHSDDTADLPAVLGPITSGAADLVIGSRTRGAHEPGALVPQARFGNWLATHWIRMWYGFRYTDLGPFRAIRFAALERLQMRDRDWGWTLEMQVRALHAGLRIVEVPVRYRRRVGRSKISGTVLGSARAARKILWTLWTLRRVPPARDEAERRAAGG